MRRVAFAVVVGSVAGLALVAEPGRASLYSPDTQFAIPFEDGKASQLPFDEFKRRRAVLANAMIEPKLGETTNPDRQAFLDRVLKKMPAPGDSAKGKLEKEQALKKMPARDSAELAVDLLRVGQVDQALNLLQPRTTDRRPDYFVFSTLGHVHAARGEWADALRYHSEGRFDTQMPAELKGFSKGQRDWWEKLDAGYLTHFYRIRADDVAARAKVTALDREKLDELEEVLPLFPLPEDGKPHAPVRFVNDAGEYQPGVLAAAEKAKLPPDAVATVQQLILWFPGDVRLYWLLAELYAAENDLESAVAIFDECTWSLKYGNRKLLMEHRNAVRAVLDERSRPPEPLITMRTILLYFGAVGVVALFAFCRVIYRRIRAARA